MFKLAAKFNVNYIISGTNIVTEYILPSAWIYPKLDFTNLSNIHKKFGSIKLKTYPKVTFKKYIKYTGFKKLIPISILDFVDYNKEEAIATIANELDWRDYGGKHCESLWTKFYQNFILPEKFGVDKRKAHLSTLICSKQITREEALKELEEPIYDLAQLEDDKAYVLKKLGLSDEEFMQILKTKPVPHEFYGTNKAKREKYMNLLQKTSVFRKLLK
jgi:hypothetical protein